MSEKISLDSSETIYYFRQEHTDRIILCSFNLIMWQEPILKYFNTPLKSLTKLYLPLYTLLYNRKPQSALT